jgi:hypothetical protein
MTRRAEGVMIVMALAALALGAYKVWNERQMTYEYRGWRIAQERTARAVESLSWPKAYMDTAYPYGL